MLQVQMPTDKSKIQVQIEVLKYAIKQDTNEKDKQIHVEALNDLQMAYNELQ